MISFNFAHFKGRETGAYLEMRLWGEGVWIFFFLGGGVAIQYVGDNAWIHPWRKDEATDYKYYVSKKLWPI